MESNVITRPYSKSGGLLTPMNDHVLCRFMRVHARFQGSAEAEDDDADPELSNVIWTRYETAFQRYG